MNFNLQPLKPWPSPRGNGPWWRVRVRYSETSYLSESCERNREGEDVVDIFADNGILARVRARQIVQSNSPFGYQRETLSTTIFSEARSMCQLRTPPQMHQQESVRV